MSDEQRPPAPRFTVPNAERYVLEADALRRRQLRSALLHGSRRTWREHRRVWPAVLVGVIVVGLICLAMAMTNAFQEQQDDSGHGRLQLRAAPAHSAD